MYAENFNAEFITNYWSDKTNLIVKLTTAEFLSLLNGKFITLKQCLMKS